MYPALLRNSPYAESFCLHHAAGTRERSKEPLRVSKILFAIAQESSAKGEGGSGGQLCHPPIAIVGFGVRWDWPFGSVEYPIGDSMGIGADLAWLVGSDDAPELEFSPVEFDPAKFTSDVMAEPPPGRGAGGEQEQAGTWQDGTGGGNLQGEPELQEGGEGLPGQRQEDLTQLPNEQRYMRGLGEIGDLADQTRGHALTASVVQARINRIKQKYALDAVRIEDRSEENVTVYVQHAAQNNRNNMVQVPIMSEAERVRLLAPAMEELQTQMNARANEQGKLNRTDADAIAHAIPQSHPVIESIRLVDGHSAWNFNVDIGDRNQQVAGKAKAEAEDMINIDETFEIDTEEHEIKNREGS